MPEVMAAPEPAPRRLIIVVVDAGLDPEIEYEGPFAAYEVTAALRRAIELVEEEDILASLEPPEEEE
jgi:hypothetical protein